MLSRKLRMDSSLSEFPENPGSYSEDEKGNNTEPITTVSDASPSVRQGTPYPAASDTTSTLPATDTVAIEKAKKINQHLKISCNSIFLQIKRGIDDILLLYSFPAQIRPGAVQVSESSERIVAGGKSPHGSGNDHPGTASVPNLPMPESFTAQNYNNVKKNPNIFLFF